MKPCICLLWAFFFSILAVPSAAENEAPPLVTDRPDFTESVLTVPRGGIQLEFGYTFSEDGGAKNHALGELLIRAGLGERVELRVGLNSWVRHDGADCTDGLEDSYLGAKFQLLDAPDEPGRLRPGVALLLGTSLPTGSDGFGEDDLQPDITLAAAWDLNQRSSISTNIGYASISEADERQDELFGSLAYGYGLSDSVGCYIEYYQFLHTANGADDPGFLNGGFTWLARDDFQFDWRAGYQLTGEGREFFIGIGGSWRWLRQ